MMVQPDSVKIRLTRLKLLFVLCSLVLITVSCGDSSTGVNGDEGEDSIGTEPTFDNIQQLFTNYCGDCHIGNRTNGVRLDSYQNVMESEGDLYGDFIIEEGNAAGSPLVDKIEPNPQQGSRMPQGGPFLSDERIEQIKQWIDKGAENDQSSSDYYDHYVRIYSNVTKVITTHIHSIFLDCSRFNSVTDLPNRSRPCRIHFKCPFAYFYWRV